MEAITAAAVDQQLDPTAHGRYDQAAAISKARRSTEPLSLSWDSSRQSQLREQLDNITDGALQQQQQSSHHHEIQQQSSENEEFWRSLPDAVFIDVLERLPPVDQG